MDNETLERIKTLNSKMLNLACHIKIGNKHFNKFNRLTPVNKLKLDKIERWLNADYNKLCKIKGV